MKRTLLIFAILGVVMALSGCLYVPVQPPDGLLYTHYKAPLQTDYEGQDFGTREGKASTQYLLVPLILVNPNFAWGDAAVKRAAESGGITTVKASDYEYLNVLGIYKKFTVVAYGD